MQQEAIQKMKENYNADKSERLEKIQSDGIEIRNKVKQLSEQKDEIESTMEVLKEEIEKETKK